MKLLLPLFLIMNLYTFSILNDPFENPEEEVEQLVIDFFEAMRSSDSELMSSYLLDESTLHTVVLSGEGSSRLRQTDIQAFLSSVSETEAGSLDEQLTHFEVRADGNLATAWMGYRFYIAGEFSHCGVNSMNLIRQESGWKIFSIVDTRHTDGC